MKTCLLLLLLGSPGWAAPKTPFDGKSDAEILGLSEAQFSGLPRDQAEDIISKAHRRLAIRTHPDMPAMAGLSEEVRLQMAKQVNGAADNLKKRFGKVAPGGGGVNRSGPASPAQENPRGGYSPRSDGKFGRSSNNPFEEAFRQAQSPGYRMFRQLVTEVQFSTQPDLRFRRNISDALYQAVMGGGFGDANFYGRFPEVEAAFLEFLRLNLHDLLSPPDGVAPQRGQMEKLLAAMELSGNPPDLVEPLRNWLETGAEPPNYAPAAAGLPCPYLLLNP